eukprot:6777916-Pyramimonas_sp.AAC.1
MTERSIDDNPIIPAGARAASPDVGLGTSGPNESGHTRPGSQDTIPPGQPSPPAPWNGSASADASCTRGPMAPSQSDGGVDSLNPAMRTEVATFRRYPGVEIGGRAAVDGVDTFSPPFQTDSATFRRHPG